MSVISAIKWMILLAFFDSTALAGVIVVDLDAKAITLKLKKLKKNYIQREYPLYKCIYYLH
jgi:hypothetical protein